MAERVEPHINNKKKRRIVFCIVFLLTLFGALMIYDSSSVYAWRLKGNPTYFFYRQLLFFVVSLFFFFSILFLELNTFIIHARKIILGIIFLLLIVLFLGKEIGGARRWFSLWGFSFQPSELLKIGFPLYFARYFLRRRAYIKNFWEGLVPLGIVCCIIFLLLILEPDMGSVIFWGVWFFSMLFIIGARKTHLLRIFLVGAVCVVILIIISPYRFQRITTFLNPWQDPQNKGYQIVQSSIAYGRGGVFGVGLGDSKQKLFFLPAAHTDFILSIIGEEFGFFGVLVIIGLFVALFTIMLNVALRIANDTYKILGVGIVLVLFLQVIINVCVTLGVFPTKGMPLPFISYGGSSLLINYIILGIYFNLSREVEK